MLGTKEHDELIVEFEKSCKAWINRTEKEPKEMWSKSVIYQDGATNRLFLTYRWGYAFAKAKYEKQD